MRDHTWPIKPGGPMCAACAEAYGVYTACLDGDPAPSIADVAKRLRDTLAQFRFAVVTWLDSGRVRAASPTIAKVKRESGLPFRVEEGALYTDGASFVALATEFGLFNGFDEVWFFNAPPPNTFPEGLRIAASTWQRGLQDEQYIALGEVAAWMLANSALLGLADGVDLEVLSTSRDLAMSLLDGLTYR